MSNALRIRSGAFGRVALLDMDRSLVRHAHPHCHVLLKIDGADTQFLVGDKVVALTGDNAVLVNAWTPHAYVHRDEAPHTLILALYIEPDWLASFRGNWAASGGDGFFIGTTGAITEHIRMLAFDLAASMAQAPDALAEHERILGALMIAAIERFTDWRGVGTSLRDVALRQGVDYRVRKAITRIRDTVDAPCSVETLAEAAGMSRANFFRVFEASTGVTPGVFRNMLRMELAVDATMSSDIALSELSERLGFSNPAHFTRFFRDHAGVPPSQFRQISRLQGLGVSFADKTDDAVCETAWRF